MKIETIALVNNSIISAIDKLDVKDGDTLVFYIRTDENGDIISSIDQVQKCHDFIQKFLSQNYNNVKFVMVPDGIRCNNEDGNR